MIKVATWNLCLGLKNKKDTVYETLREEKIDICMLQEIEIKKDYSASLLSSKDYKLEIEESNHKARCAIVIKNNIEYVRRNDLEEIDNGLVIIDINVGIPYRLICVYRMFNPPNNFTQTEHFKIQLNIIKKVHKI